MDPRLASLVFTGFGDRLLSEVKKLAPKDVKIKVRLWSVPVVHGVLGSPHWEERAPVASGGPLISSPAAAPICLLPLLPAHVLAVWPRAVGITPGGDGAAAWGQAVTCCLLPLDLGPSGAAILHMDRVRQGSQGGLGRKPFCPGHFSQG